MAQPITGTPGNDDLRGTTGNDVFDGSAGGDDRLYGYGGSDVYWLATGTDDDEIHEYVDNNGGASDTDVIRIRGDHTLPGASSLSDLPTEDLVSGQPTLSVWRSGDGNDLVVALVVGGILTDTLTVVDHFLSSRPSAAIDAIQNASQEVIVGSSVLSTARMVGDKSNNRLRGKSDRDDVFDGNRGGNDILIGYQGSDVYWLGAGTDTDTICEAFSSGSNSRENDSDVIRIKGAYTFLGENGLSDLPTRSSSTPTLSVWRSNNGNSLHVNLVVGGAAENSLVVEDHFRLEDAEIEEIQDESGNTIISADLLRRARIVGGRSNDELHGKSHLDDEFDANRGGITDKLYGYAGSDVYWLGIDTGDDKIYEYEGNPKSTSTEESDVDVIRIKSGENVAIPSIDACSDIPEESGKSLMIYRDIRGNDLHVNLMEDGESIASYVVVNHFSTSTGNAKVEAIQRANGDTIWGGAGGLDLARIVGGPGNDDMHGNGGDDVFDGNRGGNDKLYGREGSDTYWLGTNTGQDEIFEHTDNPGPADSEVPDVDVIRLRSDVTLPTNRLSGARDGEGTYLSLWRSDDGLDLHVNIMDDDSIAASLVVHDHYSEDIENAQIEEIQTSQGVTILDADDLANARIVGGPGSDRLYGSSVRDVFDSSRGGRDYLYGGSGPDVYWLVPGTGHDVILEHPGNNGADDVDRICLPSTTPHDRVRFRRNNTGVNLLVQLLNDRGEVTDSLVVGGFFGYSETAKIEMVEIGSTRWGRDDLLMARIVGGAGADNLSSGRGNYDDVFDSAAGGDDHLYGYGGNDTYWLREGTGRDSIHEYKARDSYDPLQARTNDPADTIKIDSSIAKERINIVRRTDNLVVELLSSDGSVTDSLTVVNHFDQEGAGQIERIILGDLVLRDFNRMIGALALFNGGSSSYASLDALYEDIWEDSGTLTPPSS